MDTLHLFLATVAAQDLKCKHFNIKNAFTKSHFKKDIYLIPPPSITHKKGYILKAIYNLYGLKQAVYV